ncbi:cytochrome b/b6 domain-containing protein [Rhodanobacter sp. AS-Z3]|uniref:cytochrome b/b6 domain-containing protein n=1 Tax=Rhodanobacter sp. AS-Z3 TaxID=3031330 RepID=UPI0024785C98|nr:cytochrome b/b6 domain-containing protein [Rhodanobacter sp. AS-Z3]WEN14504.1 cytochrome b/b6 domain-containing protein [Rhodanobacter sp. AS-Z3]
MNATVKVWDPLVRLFHWSLAGLFLANFFTEEGELVHRGFGYAILGLIAVRLVWGFIGTHHARFSNWVPGPDRLRHYLRDRLAGRSRRQLGHNPAAAVMILTLLGGVLLVAFTGWLQTTDRFFGDSWLEGLHEALAYGVLGLVVVHVLAAVGESLHYGENLIAAMVHGRKRALGQDAAASKKAPRLAPSQVSRPATRQE